MTPAPPNSSALLVTTGLTKQFDTNKAVNDVNLEVLAGEVYGLIGPNGAGKTTLLRMLATAEEPTAGEIYINGTRLIPDQPSPDILRIIGFLPDDFPLYDDLTVTEYLDYFAQLYYLPASEVRSRIQEVLELVSLENKRDSLISNLSRGMKQRLSLARTIIYRPKLLFLDEPVSGLDPVARVQYRETIKSLQREGMTIVVSSHILSDLEDFCTSIGVMQLGELVESTELRQLYERNRTTQKIVIATLGEKQALQPILDASPLVKSWEFIQPKGMTDDVPPYHFGIDFTGTDAEAAELLRSLIQANHPISEFAPVKASLEDIFIQLGYKQTS
ncbi:MAG: ABC transporter ATP-binding protein [Leptolyngbyaceae bacterium]|nr:ABC transporter ATP-binding protein [Leptolyngbyaceae bacterium]